MTIKAKTPEERFQYYYDIANGLDSKYQNQIDRINAESFDFNVENSHEYKMAKQENAENADYMHNKYQGNYAKFSEGYNNSMREIAAKEVDNYEKEANDEAARRIDEKYYKEWLDGKNRRIENAKKKYAKEFGNAIYNMQKANEDIGLERAGY